MFPPKKTKMKKAIAVLLSCTFLMGSIVPTYADDDAFEGWNSDTKEDAWTVYTTTEWATVQDQLLLGQASTSMKADVSRSVRNLESKVKDILKEVDGGMFAASKYTELTLAMIEVLSQGGQGYQGIPFERDPAHVAQYFDPSVKNSITQEKSIEKLVARYFAAEDAHSGQSDFASIYKSDDALMAVVQGVMFGSDYSKNNSKYTKENSQAFYNAKKASFDAKGVSPDSLFALTVKQRYSTVNIGGSGSITGGSGYVQWMINFAADDTHGYSMANRCMNPDVDCSSFVYYGLRYGAGYGTNLLGASPFSTYTMDSALKKSGFARLPRPASINDLHVGDILWCTDHTEVYVGNGKDVGAHSNKDGRPGDSSGREVSVSSCNYMFKRCTAIYRK